MLKTVLLGAALVLAVPALAQTSGSSTADMNKPGTTSSNSGMTGMSQPGSTDSGWGTGTSGTASSTATTGTTTSSTAMYTGQGGPDTTGGKTYPMCSRTIRDNCMQHGGRGHHMARRHHR